MRGQHAAADERHPRLGEVGGDEVGGCRVGFHAPRLPSPVVATRTDSDDVCHSGPMIDTWLTDTFGLDRPRRRRPDGRPRRGRRSPLRSPPAGGLGMVGVNASRSPDWVREQAAVAAAGGAPYGVGLMAWALERDEGQLDAVLDGPAGAGVGELRRRSSRTSTGCATRASGSRCRPARSTRPRAPRRPAPTWWWRAAPRAAGTAATRSARCRCCRRCWTRSTCPVVAAGGIGTARGLAAVLAAGAVGAWVGTALLTTHEAGTSRGRAAAAARRGRSPARRTAGSSTSPSGSPWPAEFGGRALRNAYFDRWARPARRARRRRRGCRRAGPRPSASRTSTRPTCTPARAPGCSREERSVADVLADLAGAEDLLRRFQV